MVSDDTEHACMTAQAVIASGGDADRFVHSLSWRLRFWMLGLPAGVGLATARAILRLWAGASWRRSGVYSAGNGPAMRSPVLGVLYTRQPTVLRELVSRSTLLTHTDPKAFLGAMAVAIAAREAATKRGKIQPDAFVAMLKVELGDDADELLSLVRRAIASVARGGSTIEFARSLGLDNGVSGYMYHTVPVVLHAWLSSPMDYEAAVSAVIDCGGDTDTTAAITGGIVGAATGIGGIPAAWVDGLAEWPCGVAWIRRVAVRSVEVAERGLPGSPVHFNVPGQLVRNLFFLAVVLLHGCRRFFPPY
jgi:ADP-ribosylglycohydrolase